MKLLKNLFLILVCLFTIVGCQKEEKINFDKDVQFKMDFYEEKAAKIAVNKFFNEYRDEITKIHDIQIINVTYRRNSDNEGVRYFEYDVVLFIDITIKAYPTLELERRNLIEKFYDIEVPIESKYLK